MEPAEAGIPMTKRLHRAQQKRMNTKIASNADVADMIAEAQGAVPDSHDLR